MNGLLFQNCDVRSPYARSGYGCIGTRLGDGMNLIDKNMAEQAVLDGFEEED